MNYQFNVSELSEQLQKGIDLLKEDYNISYDEKGCKLLATKGLDEKLIVEFKDNEARIKYHSLASFYRGFGHVLQAMSQEKTNFYVEEVSSFESNGMMFDCSRNGVLNVKTIEGMLRKLALLGHNVFMLYMEDVYELPDQPYFGYMRGRYTQEELRHVDDYAYQLGIEVIPCIQTLAHLNEFLRWPVAAAKYLDLDDILLVGSPEVKSLIEQMMSHLSQCFRSNKIHVGMDEAYHVGRGRYLDDNGYSPKITIMQEHLKLVREIAKSFNKEIIIWDDMFFRTYGRDSELTQVDVDDVNVMYWDYYGDDIDHYRKELKQRLALTPNTMFAGGAWRWIGYVPHHTKTLMTTIPALTACKELGIKDVITTSWSDDGCEAPVYHYLFGTVLFAELDYQVEFDMEVFKEKLAFISELSYEQQMWMDRIDLPNVKSANPITNVSKYALYQDPMSGIFDYHLKNVDLTEHFNEVRNNLQKIQTHNEEIRLLVEMYQSFVEVLALKWNLGLEIRKAYEQCHTSKLEDIATHQIPSLIKELKVFKSKHEALWMQTLKPQGYEIIDLRLGGVLSRLKTTKGTLIKYINGEITEIPMLEEVLLPYYYRNDGLLSFNQYKFMASASKFSF